MGLSYLSAAVILILHAIGVALYLMFLEAAIALHSTHCKDKETCLIMNITVTQAYLEAAFWPIFFFKWLMIRKGWY